MLSGQASYSLPGYVSPNTYPVIISGPCSIKFMGCTIVQTQDNFCFDISSATDVVILGNVKFQALSSATHVCLNLSGSSRVAWRAKTYVTGVPTTGLSWLQAISCNDCVFEGPFHSTDSALVHLTNCNRIVIRNVTCGPYSSDPNYNVIKVDTYESGTFIGLVIADCLMDGGANFGSTVNSNNPFILVDGSGAGSRPTDITISNCAVRNAANPGNPSTWGSGGITVLNVVNATVSDCVAESVLFGFSLVGPQITCVNCVAANCFYPGFQIGDSSNQSGDVYDVILNGCVASNCGTQGNQGGVQAGISLQSKPIGGGDTYRIFIVGCDSVNITGGSQNYGIATNNTAGISAIYVTKCNFTGKTAPIFDQVSPSVGIVVDAYGLASSNAEAVVGIDDRGPLSGVDLLWTSLYTVGSGTAGAVDELLWIEVNMVTDVWSGTGANTYTAQYTDSNGTLRSATVTMNATGQGGAHMILRCKVGTVVQSKVTAANTSTTFYVSTVVKRVRLG